MREIHLAGAAVSLLGTCTLACRHCYSSSSPLVQNAFSRSDLFGFIDVFVDRGISHIFFGGGEPLLHLDLALVIKHAKDRGMTMSISTNGHLLDKQRIKMLFEAGVRYELSVSLDGPSAKVNDVIRGSGSFMPTIAGMYELGADGRIMWGVNYVSCKLNVGQAVQTAALSKRLGASYFNLNRFTPYGRGKLNAHKFNLSDEEFEGEVRQMSEQFDRIGEFYGDIHLFDLRGDLKQRGTTSFFNDERFQGIPSGISIDHTGRVTLTPADIDLGNCKTHPLGELVDRTASEDVVSVYRKWLKCEHRGIHQPLAPVENL